MALLPTLLVAAACGAWHPGVLGHYDGVVESNNTSSAETWIVEDADGRLSGRYVLHEAGRDVPGTLAASGDGDCREAWFRWTDLYGFGMVRLRFDPDTHCFEGEWGTGLEPPTHPWLTCTKPPQVSSAPQSPLPPGEG